MRHTQHTTSALGDPRLKPLHPPPANPEAAQTSSPKVGRPWEAGVGWRWGSNNLGPPAGAPLVRKDAKDATVTPPPVAPIPYGVHHPRKENTGFQWGGMEGPRPSQLQNPEV